MKIRNLWTTRAVWGLLLCLCLIVCLTLLVFPTWGTRYPQAINAFNPMQWAFLASFSVVNQTGETVDIVPIGMVAQSGLYAPLPRYRDFFPPAVPIGDSQSINLGQLETTKITYDYDDINFRHILVRDKAGKLYIFDTDRKGTKKASYGPQKDIYIIPQLSHLHPAPEILSPCFRGEAVRYTDAKEYP